MTEPRKMQLDRISYLLYWMMLVDVCFNPEEIS